MEYKCLESINSLYIDKDARGYLPIPCCLYKERILANATRSTKIEDLLDNPYLKEVQEGFKGEWDRPGCIDCKMKEQSGLTSKRQRSLKRGNDDNIRSWDIRPGNTCNLKCVMCNPWNSSKWFEDIAIFNRYSQDEAKIGAGKDREDIDWDWIYEKCIDTAEKIYIAGGEPFYMKQVHTFLEKLSKHEWNRQHTEIQIQTNGMSNTSKFLDTLSKFKRLSFSISIDGWKEVNELIRFPTNHEVLEKNVQDLRSINPMQFEFNITTQALNLPNLDTLVYNIENEWNGKCTIQYLKNPSHLSVNCLKPHVVEKVIEETSIEEIKQRYTKNYKFDEVGNATMQTFLIELDAKRGTDSARILPWCFE